MTEKVWQTQVGGKENDLTKLQFCLAVFCLSDNKIYKLSCLDIRGQRFDVSGEKMTRWIDFSRGVLFDYTNREEFNKYYTLYSLTYSKHRNREFLLKWLQTSSERLGMIDTCEGLEEKNTEV